MNVDMIHAEVNRIKTIKDDDEAAHVAEDGLYVAVLRAISAMGQGTGAELALAALEATEIKFSRWCA